MTRRALLLSAVALALAGCGGGSGGGSPSYPDAPSVAKAAGCTSFTKDAPEMYAVAGGHCTFKGHDTVIQWFNDGSSMDTWERTAVTASKAVGIATDGMFLTGHNWAIECHSTSDCAAMKDQIGGSLT